MCLISSLLHLQKQHCLCSFVHWHFYPSLLLQIFWFPPFIQDSSVFRLCKSLTQEPEWKASWAEVVLHNVTQLFQVWQQPVLTFKTNTNSNDGLYFCTKVGQPSPRTAQGYYTIASNYFLGIPRLSYLWALFRNATKSQSAGLKIHNCILFVLRVRKLIRLSVTRF